MSNRHGGWFTLCVLLCLLTAPHAQAEWAFVERVFDGDTFALTDGTHVRVEDIDTPETHHPRIGREPGGEEASALARAQLEGRRVWLEGTFQDKYGRRLARVRLPSGQWYGELVRARGYDKRSARPSAAHVDRPVQQAGGQRRESAKVSGAGERTWVRGYHRRDGTWVSGHWRRQAGD